MNQKQALDILKLGHNVFLTGAAGAGKTFLLNQYIAYLNKHNVKMGITASTGIAATHMNGVTIDSWSGLGMRMSLTEADINELQNKLHLKLRLLGAKVLIIDEVSMIHAGKLDLIDKICRVFRGNNLPFGGIQVIFCGDFFQLPPVGEGENGDDYIFKSHIWNNMDLRICYLEKAHRQKEEDYLQILNAIRANHVPDTTLQILIKRIGHPIHSSITIPKLYTHNVDVDLINAEELEKINEKPHVYEMQSKGMINLIESMKKACLAPEKLILKKHVIVMFVRNNVKAGFVNGTLGKIIGFDRSNNPVVELFSKRKITVYPMSWNITENNVVRAEITQVPLRLAWAITVHKSQGMTLDAAEVDLSKAFVTGMGYVALSRVKSLSGLRLLGLNKMALQVNSEIVELDKWLRLKSQEEVEKLHQLGWLKRFMQKRRFMYKITS